MTRHQAEEYTPKGTPGPKSNFCSTLKPLCNNQPMIALPLMFTAFTSINRFCFSTIHQGGTSCALFHHSTLRCLPLSGTYPAFTFLISMLRSPFLYTLARGGDHSSAPAAMHSIFRLHPAPAPPLSQYTLLRYLGWCLRAGGFLGGRYSPAHSPLSSSPPPPCPLTASTRV